MKLAPDAGFTQSSLTFRVRLFAALEPMARSNRLYSIDFLTCLERIYPYESDNGKVDSLSMRRGCVEP